jgi:hypothetical protein
MSESHTFRVWVVKELGLPAIVKACPSCRSARHHPTGKFRVNANAKLLDVWMLIGCELCGRTSKIPVHERVNVRALDHERLLMFENNEPAMVRHLATDAALAAKAGYRLDWSGTWELETGLDREDSAPLEIAVRFELPAPIRVGKLLTAGFGLSRSTIAGMVASGRIRLPMALEAKARHDFTFRVLPMMGPMPGTAGPRFRLGGVTAYARIGRVQARPQDLYSSADRPAATVL